MKAIISIFAFAALIACHSPKSTTDSKAQTSSVPDSIYRFTVSFISIGSGTDKKAQGDFDRFVIQYGEKNNLKLNHETTTWGREGEIDYCFKLGELKKEQQDEFISGTKEVLKNSTLVRYKENMTCRKSNKK